MDSAPLPVSEAARILGVSLPTVHRMLDSESVPSRGRGSPRAVPKRILEEAVRERGAVPETVPGRTRSELLVLAALARSPLGRDSARDVASTASMSPTTAAAALERLLDERLVSHDDEKVARGRVRKTRRWRARAHKWDPALARVVRQITLPLSTAPASAPQSEVPKRFHHLFWNAAAAELDVTRDGAYIAGRMLDSLDVEAWTWALEHIGRDQLTRSTNRRGVSERARALVANWMRHVSDVSSAVDGGRVIGQREGDRS